MARGDRDGVAVEGQWLLDCAGEDCDAARRVSLYRSGWQGGIQGHAGRPGALFVPGKAGRFSDTVEREQPGECDQRRRADTGVSGANEKGAGRGESVIVPVELRRARKVLIVLEPRPPPVDFQLDRTAKGEGRMTDSGCRRTKTTL